MMRRICWAAVVVVGVCLLSEVAAGVTVTYEFVEVESRLRRTGGFAGVDETFNVCRMEILPIPCCFHHSMGCLAHYASRTL